MPVKYLKREVEEVFTVIVVEDEPASLNYLCNIIRKKCPKYKIIGTAEDGLEGLEIIRKQKPDLVITDVRMPMLDGIELIKKFREEMPYIAAIVVSGYQEFEYAKNALKAGVYDYLLKPVSINGIVNVLENLETSLSLEQYRKRTALIKKLSKGIEVDNKMLEKYFLSGPYYGAIIRKNSLPRRFSDGESFEMLPDNNEIMFLYGRDEMECLYICPQEYLNFLEFKAAIEKKIPSTYIGNTEGYTTAIIASEPFETTMLSHIISRLYHALNRVSSIGVTQTAILEETEKGTGKVFQTGNIFTKFEYLIQQQDYIAARREFAAQIEGLKKIAPTQLQTEEIIRQMLQSLKKHNYCTEYYESYEYMLDDAFYFSTSYDDLKSNMLDIFDKLTNTANNIDGRVDTAEFFDTIKKYLEDNFSQQISLTEISKKFCISQTYFSRLFRKYMSKSFNEYLTMLRISKAKELLKNNDDLLIKDIAAMVGYKDQFYFSRLFHTVTGKPPSEYYRTK